MRRYLKKVKHWIRIHRLSRRHAALQNFCFALLLAVLCGVLLQGYIKENSVEAAVNRWCEENMFGDAEIYAIRTCDLGKHSQKDVVFGKVMPNGDRYEASVQLWQENPLKWVCVGHAIYWDPINYADKTTPEEMKECFLELAPYTQIYAEKDAYLHTSIGDNNEILDVRRIPSVTVLAVQEAAKDGTVYKLELRITMDLETGEIHSYIDPLILNGKEEELWISEERMRFIAEKMMDAIE